MDEHVANRTEKRAKAIFQMGLVARVENGFKVHVPRIGGDSQYFTVKRDETGKVVCDCHAFHRDPETRCEHILAVKHYLLDRTNQEAV